MNKPPAPRGLSWASALGDREKNKAADLTHSPACARGSAGAVLGEPESPPGPPAQVWYWWLWPPTPWVASRGALQAWRGAAEMLIAWSPQAACGASQDTARGLPVVPVLKQEMGWGTVQATGCMWVCGRSRAFEEGCGPYGGSLERTQHPSVVFPLYAVGWWARRKEGERKICLMVAHQPVWGCAGAEGHMCIPIKALSHKQSCTGSRCPIAASLNHGYGSLMLPSVSRAGTGEHHFNLGNSWRWETCFLRNLFPLAWTSPRPCGTAPVLSSHLLCCGCPGPIGHPPWHLSPRCHQLCPAWGPDSPCTGVWQRLSQHLW